MTSTEICFADRIIWNVKPKLDCRISHEFMDAFVFALRSLKVFWSSQNRSILFDQTFVYGTLMGVDYKQGANLTVSRSKMLYILDILLHKFQLV